MQRFDGKVAIVTGAGSGFGEAIATLFAREGARVVVSDVNDDNGRRVAAAIEKEGGAVERRPGVTVYNATKGAVVTLTRGLAGEVAQFKIRVNAVNPVAAETGFIKTALGVDRLPDELRKQFIAGVPLGRLTQPSDVA